MTEESHNPLLPPQQPEAEDASADDLRQRVIDELSLIYDPEIPVNIYELGLIYKVEVDEKNHVTIRMTLTAPSCPVAGELPGQVEARVRALEGVEDAKVDLVWDPPWNQSMMSEAAKLQLGLL